MTGALISTLSLGLPWSASQSASLLFYSLPQTCAEALVNIAYRPQWSWCVTHPPTYYLCAPDGPLGQNGRVSRRTHQDYQLMLVQLIIPVHCRRSHAALSSSPPSSSACQTRTCVSCLICSLSQSHLPTVPVSSSPLGRRSRALLSPKAFAQSSHSQSNCACPDCTNTLFYLSFPPIFLTSFPLCMALVQLQNCSIPLTRS